MATLHGVLNDLHTLKNAAKITRDQCYSTKCNLFSGVIRELSGLSDVVGDAQIYIYRPQFKSHPNLDQYLLALYQITKESQTAVQDFAVGQLAEYGNTRRESGSARAERGLSKSRLESDKSQFATAIRQFRRLLDQLGGREDWSKFSPKEPLAPSPRITSNKSASARNSPIPPSLSAFPPKPASAASTSPKPPPSPFQATVEDIEDDPQDEPSNVNNYFVHPEEVVGMDKGKGKQRAMAAFVPSVFVRAPTEPLDDMVPHEAKTPVDKGKMPLKSAMKKTSPNSSGGNSNDPSPKSRASDDIPSSSIPLVLPKPPLGGDHIDNLEQRIQQLQADLSMRRTASGGSYTTDAGQQSGKRLSVDFGRTEEFVIREPRHGRQRAATTTGTERPPAFRFGSETDVKRRTPRQSPREPYREYTDAAAGGRSRTSPRQSARQYDRSPRVPPSPTFQQPEPFDPYTNAGFYPMPSPYDHRTSLPTVLEGGRIPDNYPNPRRTPRPSPRAPSLDQTYDDFFHHPAGAGGSGALKGEDFELFGPAMGPPIIDSTHTSPRQRQPSLLREDSWTPVLEHELPVSLEHLYYGTTMKAQIHRKIQEGAVASGRTVQQEHAVNITIPPGLKAGSRIKFKGAGDVTSSGSQDIHFIVKEAPHPLYTRHTSDLHTTLDLPLLDSLLGWSRTLKTICGKQIKVSHPGPTPPTWQDCLPGLGMCERREPDRRGDLIVKVRVVWPNRLTDRQKRLLVECFEGG